MAKRYQLNLNKITFEATKQLQALDSSFVGTKDYMGLTYFWAYEYRHLLRDNRKYWIRVHTALLKAGLNVSEESIQHEEIIKRILGIK